jgi:hypothetical protein
MDVVNNLLEKGTVALTANEMLKEEELQLLQ